MAQFMNTDPAVRRFRYLSKAAAKAAGSGDVLELTAKGVRVSEADAKASNGRLTAGALDPRTQIARHRAEHGHLAARDPKSWGAYNRKETDRFKAYLAGTGDLTDADVEMLNAEVSWRLAKELPGATRDAVVAEVATRFDVPQTPPKKQRVKGAKATGSVNVTASVSATPTAKQKRDAITRKKQTA